MRSLKKFIIYLNANIVRVTLHAPNIRLEEAGRILHNIDIAFIINYFPINLYYYPPSLPATLVFCIIYTPALD